MRAPQRTRSVCLWTCPSASGLPVFFERKLTIVLPKEIEKSLVLALFHVEEPGDDLVVAARLFESLADEVADVALRDLTLQIQRIDCGPERLAILDEAFI